MTLYITMQEAYDGIILGTGHNALVLQAYMARSGLHILSLDRAPVAGGGLATIENPRFPGFWHNTHSFFHRALTTMPWYCDLELERHGASYIEPELNVALITADGRALEWWTDLDRTVASFEAFSRKDAASLRRWVEIFRPIVERILIPEAQSPPLPPAKRTELLARSQLGRTLLKVAALSPLEFVAREFEHDVVRAGLLFFNGLREIDLRLKGFGHSIPALLAGRHFAQMCRGGSARLAQALVGDIREHGGEVATGVELQGILCRNGKAVGITLAGGETITARAFVASGLNPQQTFLKLLDADSVSREVREKAAGFQYNTLAPLFALNLALHEPPHWRAAAQHPELNKAFMVILGLERFAQFSEIVASHEKGQIPETVMWGACPTLFDPSQAPPGKHTLFMWEKVPYNLQGSPTNWEREKGAHSARLLSLLRRSAINLGGDAVIDSFARTPVDTEISLPNMKAGDLLVGSLANNQVGYNRPFPGAGQYRTPVKGLYLCGGSSHPGGNITGLCGYNAARVLASDLGSQIWWNPPQWAVESD
ncbi:MAG TPA: NAD(P)/FAD-dependent oxidoreductase [Terriglobia bacterium]|nr:NAD(P)/FAD-dependent oxidoreductase [Terriglobia bacterium]